MELAGLAGITAARVGRVGECCGAAAKPSRLAQPATPDLYPGVPAVLFVGDAMLSCKSHTHSEAYVLVRLMICGNALESSNDCWAYLHHC